MDKVFTKADHWKWVENIAIFGIKAAAEMACKRKVPFDAFYYIAFGRYPWKGQ